MKKNKKFTLVLSGGGANAIAHLPVLELLEKHALTPDYIIGTSMGALLGGLYASGMSCREIKEQSFNFNPLQYIDTRHHTPSFVKKTISSQHDPIKTLGTTILAAISSKKSGVIQGDKIYQFISQLSQGKKIENCSIPFICNAVNIQNGKEVVFEQGDLAQAIRCSISIPGVFEPVRIDDQILVDGGVLSNLATHIAQTKKTKKIVAIDTAPQGYKQKKITSMSDVLDRVFSISLTRKGDLSLNNKILNIYPTVDDHFFDFFHLEKIYNLSCEAIAKDEQKILDYLNVR